MSRRKVSLSLSPAHFVEVWQRAESVDDVCEKIGMPREAVLNRSRRYRDNGVRLKVLVKESLSARGRKPLDVDALNRIVDEIESGRKPARR